MNDYKDFFGSKYPIVCLPMNQVSDIDLALAIQEAGAFPSISVFNFYKNGSLDKEYYSKELKRFKDNCDSGLMNSMPPELFLDDSFMKIFFEIGFQHVEVYHSKQSSDSIWTDVREKMSYYKDMYDAKIIFKTLKVLKNIQADTVILKGSEAAGRSSVDAEPIKESFFKFKDRWPDIKIIPSGGIYNSEQVDFYMNNGALAIGIGSLFAISKESKVSLEVKNKILKSTLEDLSHSGSLNLQGVFFKMFENDDINMTKSLAAGIQSTDQGCIFMGHAVSHITEILSVKDIVDKLCYHDKYQ